MSRHHIVLAAAIVAMLLAGATPMTARSVAAGQEAAAERSIVPRTPTAASDGLPVAMLIAGIVLAFGVGVYAGTLHRQRRSGSRARPAETRPTPVTTPPRTKTAAAAAPPPPPARRQPPRLMELPRPPAKPTPEPPRAEPPKEPAPAARAEPPKEPTPAARPEPPKEPAPAARAEPPKEPEQQPTPEPPRPEAPVEPAHAERRLQSVPPPAKPASMPPPSVSETPEEAKPKPRRSRATGTPRKKPASKRAKAPAERAKPAKPRKAKRTATPAKPAAERRPAKPRRRARTARPPADAPLSRSPEIPRLADSAAEPLDRTAPLAQAPEALRMPSSDVNVPVRRFAPTAPWPRDVDTLWTCELDWKAGYRRSSFRAMVAAPGESRRVPFGESPPVAWTLMADPDPPTPELAVRVRALMQALEAAGWSHIGRGEDWYAQRFVWRGGSDPPPIDVPELEESPRA